MRLVGSMVVLICVSSSAVRGESPTAAALWSKLAPFAQPPAEFAGQFGSYRSPLLFADGTRVKSPEDWATPARARSVVARAAGRLAAVGRTAGGKAAGNDRKRWLRPAPRARADFAGRQSGRRLSADPVGKRTISRGVRAVLRTANEHRRRGQGTRHARLRFAAREKRVRHAVDRHTGLVEKVGLETRQLLIEAGKEQERQPLTLLAYVAANCHTALAQMPEVIPDRIGIIGLSYGGKWSMFASCLHEKFACAVWSDPGIVFDEKNANVNYWEPWYLGRDPAVQRKPGVPSDENPRTGLYKKLVDCRRRPGRFARADGTPAGSRFRRHGRSAAELAGPQSPRRGQRSARPEEPRLHDRSADTRPDSRSARTGTGVSGVLAQVWSRAFVDHAFFHHEDHVVHGADVLQRIAFDGDDVGDLFGLDRAQAVVDLQQPGGFAAWPIGWPSSAACRRRPSVRIRGRSRRAARRPSRCRRRSSRRRRAPWRNVARITGPIAAALGRTISGK